MQPKYSKKNVFKSAKTSSSQDLVYQHMSNHYRRILNAKKTIDTSPPYCYKPRRPATVKRQTSAPASRNQAKGRQKIESSRNTSPVLTERSISTNSYKESFWGTESVVGSSRYHAACVQSYTRFVPPPRNTYFNMDLINRITYDTKHGPATYCDENWTEVNCSRSRQTEKKYKHPATVCAKSSEVSMNPKRSLQSRESDTKLKRKFSSRMKEEPSTEMPIKCTLDPAKCKCTKICVCDDTEETLHLKKNPDNPKEQSQTSSRDSAYNGGVSSLPESRSPTPDQRTKKECGCIVEDESFYCEKKKSNDMKVNENSKDVERSRDCHCGRTESPIGDSSGSDLTMKSKAQNEDSLKKLKDDAVYIKFIQDITVEILEKSLYTNKALKRVMKRHFINNQQTLDNDRMIKELENLRIQLGIPQDDKFFDIESDSMDNVESCTEFLKPFPVISDSAFVIPKEDGETSDTKKTGGKETLAKVSKTQNHEHHNYNNREQTKEILLKEIDVDTFESDSEDDEELISVIQMTKATRDKRKEESIKTAKTKGSSNEGNSSEDESIKCKNKSKFQKIKCRNCSCHVSSDSDESKDKRTKITVKTKSTKN